MNTKRILGGTLTMGVAAVLLGCGGGEPTAAGTTAAQAAQAPRARALATGDANALSGEEAAGQLFNFAEQSQYQTYFPGHPATGTSAPFTYRYYPDTQTYLGVAVGNSPPYLDGHVYVMGGVNWPNGPVEVGALTSFINPSKAFVGVWTGQSVAAVGGAVTKLHAIGRPNGDMMIFAYEDCHVYTGGYYTNGASVVYTTNAEWKYHCFGATEKSPAGWDGSGTLDGLQKNLFGSGSATAGSEATLSLRSAVTSNLATMRLSYSPLNGRTSSLAKLAGSYTTMHPGPTSMVATAGSTVTIAADGSFVGAETASNGIGLVKRSYTGQFSLIDPAQNLYALSIKVDGETMTGYAFMSDSASGKTDDAIYLAAKQANWGPFVHYWTKK